MSDKPESIAAKYATRFKNPPIHADRADAVLPGDGTVSSTINASKRRTPLFLDLVKKNGTHKALSYAYLVAIEYDKKTITLEFTGYRVSLSGRTLDDTFRRLLAQVIGQIREVDELTDKATGDPKKPAVYTLKWEKV